MGRVAQGFKIPIRTFSNISSKIEKPLYEEMKELAHLKAMSVHTLIEIVLGRYIEEQKR